ncbi:hypothetical protein FNV43_RR08975 [Rhamnella rubrinervis]|uniref:Uncharacterized protein n=1 Tax=Rhamnella rubrinervis TaxID=2594499 RepID=A0A8K0H962_9ROSA|nr:hypothetical protein FNV43_RR08975 [Rhamnella rubrinervis]
MAKPNVVHIEGVLTITPSKITEPRQVRQVSANDPIGLDLFGQCLHVVLYYKKASQEDSGWLQAGWMKESLARALADQPMISGRLCRRLDIVDDDLDQQPPQHDQLEIVSNDSGVRLMEARIPTTLSEFLDSKTRQVAEAELVFWKDIDEQNPQFCPLFFVQVTNFECGGYSIGISCSLLLADLLFKEKCFLQKWAKIHNNITSQNNNAPKTPIFYLPNLKKDGFPVEGFFSSRPSKKNSGQTFIFKIGIAETSVAVDNTLALLCVEEAESKLSNKMASEFPLFLNHPNNAVQVEKCSKLHAATTLSPKPNLGITSEGLGWDDILGAEDVEFLAGNQPLHVSHWIGSISGGLVYCDHEGLFGGKIMVTIPKESTQI